MVLAAGKHLARYGERALIARADAAQLPFDDNSFDLALSFLMLHHVRKWEVGLRELVRVVRPLGRVLGCDMIDSRFPDWSERAFGSGEERLISPRHSTARRHGWDCEAGRASAARCTPSGSFSRSRTTARCRRREAAPATRARRGRTVNLKGGMASWRRAGLPLEPRNGRIT